MDSKQVMLSATFILLCFSLQLMAQGNVGIGTTTPDSSAALDVVSTTQGLLPPRMTETQRDALVSPADGLMIFNITSGCLNYYFAGSWFESCGDEIVPFTCGTSTVTFTYNGSSVTYGTVVGANSRCWLDRNLGATQVATSSTDTASYGDLFQWGRLDDGHQVRNPLSGTTTTLSSIDVPGHADFITPSGTDWRSPQNTNLWQGVNGVNNPCPSGFRLPTNTELDAERLSWSTDNAAGAFASPLKLPMAGYRGLIDGSLYDVGSFGAYWSSAVSSFYSNMLYFEIGYATIGPDFRATGNSVRCLKD